MVYTCYRMYFIRNIYILVTSSKHSLVLGHVIICSMELAFMFAYCYTSFALHRCIPSFAGTQVNHFLLLERVD
jgi:hypothetical protein